MLPWLTVQFNYSANEPLYLKFFLPSEDFTRCPVLILELHNFFGSSSLFVSNDKVPTDTEFLVCRDGRMRIEGRRDGVMEGRSDGGMEGRDGRMDRRRGGGMEDRRNGGVEGWWVEGRKAESD
jgi:hypothetical protein